jgi:hypothetical protein
MTRPGRLAAFLVAVACAAVLRAPLAASASGAPFATQGPPSVSGVAATYLLVIVGLGGDPENADRFHKWALTLVDAARGKYSLPADHVIYLGEDPARDPAHIGGRSTREAVVAAFDKIASNARPTDRVLVVLIGHGASATGAARFNLPGPDLTAPEFAKLLDRLAAQTVVFVNTASASGGFVPALAGKNRAVITATKTDGEKNQTRFGEFFTAAFASADEDADTDKDGRVSILEAFLWARARTADSYNRDGQLLTEHAVLDDDGDGKGMDAAGQPGADGTLARSFFLSASSPRAAVDLADPAVRELVARRDGIEAKIAALRAAKDRTDPAQYERDLEQLLIDLARVNREIREKQK